MDDFIVGREALYDLVWREPISKLAERYGYSDTGFAKLCRRAGVPLPSRGHWARVSAGQRVRQTPLPALNARLLRQVRLMPLSEAEIRTRQAKRDQHVRTKELLFSETVASEVADLHPLAKAARKRLKQAADTADHKGLRSAPKEVLDIEVTKGSIDRATRIASLVVRGLYQVGAMIRVDEQKGRTLLELHDTLLTLKISEHVARARHEQTPAEKRALERYWAASWTGEFPKIPQHDFTPTGLLTITAFGWPARNWRDTARTPIENRLDEVISGIISLADEVRDREFESARRSAEHLRKQERYAFEIERRIRERSAFDALVGDAQKWAAANQLRDYLRAVESATPELTAWLEWAARKADWLDPTVKVSDDILDSPEPEEPGYSPW